MSDFETRVQSPWVYAPFVAGAYSMLATQNFDQPYRKIALIAGLALIFFSVLKAFPQITGFIWGNRSNSSRVILVWIGLFVLFFATLAVLS